MIRKAEIKDVRKIAEFMKQFEQATAFVRVDVDHTTKAYERFVADGSTTLLILEEDGVMQGGLGFIVAKDLHSGELTAMETYWFVAPEHRGGGVALMEEYEKEARKQGVKNIGMAHLVDSYPDVLEELYSKKGFTLVEKHWVKEV